MVLIIDIETTGLRGLPIDRVLEVGICEYDECERTITPIYGEIIRYEDMDGFKVHYESFYNEPMFIFDEGHLTVEDCMYAAKSLDTVVEDVRGIVHGDTITSYNTNFDFNKFLYHEPWGLDEITLRPFDIMVMATRHVKEMAMNDRVEDKELQDRMLRMWENNPDRWIRSLDAYRSLCPDDPIGLSGVQSHRALDDAIMEAHILDAIFSLTGI